MEQIPCVHCGQFFIPRNRGQNYCKEPKCQRARKAQWQKYKMKTDPEYRTQQKLSHQKWLQNKPDYWKRYRERNPEKNERNQALQHVRNRRKRSTCHPDTHSLIAKMDARNPIEYRLVGQFYLVPVIAKMDVRKVNIYSTSKGYI